MKSLLYYVISIIVAVTLSSSILAQPVKTHTLVLQATVKNAGQPLLKQSADIISARLKIFGINSFNIKIAETNDQLLVTLPDTLNIKGIEGLFTAKGDLAFYETYGQNEISGIFKNDDQIFKVIDHIPGQRPSDPRIGCKKAGSDITLKPVKDCKLVWGLESDEGTVCLFALKTGIDGSPVLGRTHLESVKISAMPDQHDPKIQIKLDPSGTASFAEVTGKNVNKSIAIVIDDKVYSWPVVRDAIEGGEIEITGKFTAREVKFLPAIFNSPQMPLAFNIIK